MTDQLELELRATLCDRAEALAAVDAVEWLERFLDDCAPLDHMYLEPGVGEITGAGQSIVACTDDDDVARLGRHGAADVTCR